MWNRSRGTSVTVTSSHHRCKHGCQSRHAFLLPERDFVPDVLIVNASDQWLPLELCCKDFGSIEQFSRRKKDKARNRKWGDWYTTGTGRENKNKQNWDNADKFIWKAAEHILKKAVVQTKKMTGIKRQQIHFSSGHNFKQTQQHSIF